MSHEPLDLTMRHVRELSHLRDPRIAAQLARRRLETTAPPGRLFHLSRQGVGPDRIGLVELVSWPEQGGADTCAREDLPAEGLLAEILDLPEPRVIEMRGSAGDGLAGTLLEGSRSLIAVPVFRLGRAEEVLLLASDHPVDRSQHSLLELTWLANLLVQAADVADRTIRLRRAYSKLDGDLDYIASLQRRLLPRALPDLAGAEVWVHSVPSERSGGDYYDFFSLPEGRWGVLLADICGHGTATAVHMAITHAIAHLARPFVRPGAFLEFLNRQLARHYMAGTEAFVTACACVFDPATRALTYAVAGHPAPRLKRGASVLLLDRARGAGLGLSDSGRFRSASVRVRPSDVLVLFTDGLTETRSPEGDRFGEERLDQLVALTDRADELVGTLESAAAGFGERLSGQDDRTIVALRFS